MVGSSDRSAVGLYDRFAYCQTNTNPFISVGGSAGGLLALKQAGHLLFADPFAIITDAENNRICLLVNRKFYRLTAARVNKSIFHEIDKHLFDQCGIHGKHEEIVRHMDFYLHTGMPFLQTQNGL